MYTLRRGIVCAEHGSAGMLPLPDWLENGDSWIDELRELLGWAKGVPEGGCRVLGLRPRTQVERACIFRLLSVRARSVSEERGSETLPCAGKRHDCSARWRFDYYHSFGIESR